MGRIASAAGLNKQLIYYYFESKAGLHAAATATADRDEPQAETGKRLPGPEAIRAAVRACLDYLDRRPEIAVALADPAAAEGQSSAAAWVERTTAHVAAILSSGQGLGHFRDDIEPEMLARQLVVLCVGYAALRPRPPVPPGDWAEGVVATVLRAASW